MGSALIQVGCLFKSWTVINGINTVHEGNCSKQPKRINNLTRKIVYLAQEILDHESDEILTNNLFSMDNYRLRINTSC